MRTALVTGHCGFVGNHLVSHLVENGDQVHGFDILQGQDVRNYEALRMVIEKADPDDIYHLAAQASPAESLLDPRRAMEVNIVGALNLLEAVRRLGSRARILLVGTSEEYGYENQDGPISEKSPCLPTTPYGVSKLAAGQLGLSYAARYGMHVVAVRPFNHTGPGQHPRYAVSGFARRIVQVEKGHAEVIEHGPLGATRNYTDVRDIVRAYRLAIDSDPGVYNICSPWKSKTMEQLLNELLKLAKCKVVLVPNEHLGTKEKKGCWYEPNANKLRRETQWVPEILLNDSLRDVLDYWRAKL